MLEITRIELNMIGGTCYLQKNQDGRERVWCRTGERYAECTFSPKVDFQGGSVMARISMKQRFTLHLVPSGVINAKRYIDEMSAAFVVPHAEIVGADFPLINDNVRPHAALIVREYLNNAGTPHIEWLTHSPDLNHIEHFWDMLGW